MTNREKFKEVFGYEMTLLGADCRGFECSPDGCLNCDYCQFWNRDYEGADDQNILMPYDAESIEDLIKNVRAKARAEYEAECKKLFSDNPPMHFTSEQVMWIKERMKMSRQDGRVDAIEDCIQAIEPNMQYHKICEVLEDLKERKNE